MIQIFLQTQGIGVLEKNRERFKIGKVVGVIVQPGNGSDTLVVKRQRELMSWFPFSKTSDTMQASLVVRTGFVGPTRQRHTYAASKGKAGLLGAVEEMNSL